jgi:hypothetical protein
MPTRRNHRVLRKLGLLQSGVHKEKVLAVRWQLAGGKYEVDERLNVALDKLIEDIINEKKSTAVHR